MLKKFLYIGSFSSDELIFKRAQLDGRSVDFATNNFQWALIKTLKHPKFNGNVTIFTCPFFRSNKSIFNLLLSHVKGEDWCDRDGIIFYSSSNWTIPILRHIHEFVSTIKFVFKQSKIDEYVVFSLHTSFLLPVLIRKLIHSDARVTVVVDDLPIFMSSSRNLFYRFLKFFDASIQLVLNRYVDRWIFLSDQMADYFKADRRCSFLLEAIYADSDSDSDSDTSSSVLKTYELEGRKYFLYAGNLNESHGIHNLIADFKRFNQDEVCLVVVGSGDLYLPIKNLSHEVGSNIKIFNGLSRRDINTLMSNAVGLVMTTSPSRDFVKYFFPSKLIEYMASGSVTISTKLPCIPAEYFDHLILVNDGDFYSAMKSVLDMAVELRMKIGDEARRFILNNKGVDARVVDLNKFMEDSL